VLIHNQGEIMRIKQLDHLNMTVANLAESLEWYGSVFGFELVEGGVRNGVSWAIIRSGEAMLCLYEHPDRRGPRRFMRDDRGEHCIYHYGFRIDDEEAWLEKIETHDLSFDFGGVTRYPHSTSWYVVDPTGYSIEVVLWDEDCVSFEPPVALAS